MSRLALKAPKRALILLLVAVVLPLAGCGKKADPRPPPDVPNTYPRTYPGE
jgi:predicted small lipoprotein YifL